MSETMRHQGELFHRSQANPILSAADWPYPVHSVFNPGATKLRDGRTLLLCRCEDHRGISHFCKAISPNGVSDWDIDRKPTLEADPKNHPEELWGIEDPRITFLEDEGRYAVVYTAFGKTGPGVALALTADFVKFERLGLIMQPDDKDACLLPRKVDGQYLLIHRPMTMESADIWITQSPNLRTWGKPTELLRARKGAWWDANKIGLCTPPIETPEGWLMTYHGVRVHASGSLYRMGLALLDKQDPCHALLRGDSWIFGPEEMYERTGDVPNVIFPCGYTVHDDDDTLNFYYGAADTCVCLATARISELMKWLHAHGNSVLQDLPLDPGMQRIP